MLDFSSRFEFSITSIVPCLNKLLNFEELGSVYHHDYDCARTHTASHFNIDCQL